MHTAVKTVNFEVVAVLGESPIAKPANHEPSANMVWPLDAEPDPEYVEPEFGNPVSEPDPGIVVPCWEDDPDPDIIGVESLDDFWLYIHMNT